MLKLIQFSILCLSVTTFLSACGSSDSKPGAPGNNFLLQKIGPPEGAQRISKNDLATMFQSDITFQTVKGMFNEGTITSVVHLTATPKDKKPVDITCPSQGKTTIVILKADTDGYYTFSETTTLGKIENETCSNSAETEISVSKEPLMTSFDDLTKNMTADSSISYDYYNQNGNLIFYADTVTNSDGNKGSGQILLTLKNPKNTPVMIGFMSLKFSTQNKFDYEYYSGLVEGTVLYDITRSGSGFDVGSLREKLKNISYCDETATERKCETKDMTSLLN